MLYRETRNIQTENIGLSQNAILDRNSRCQQIFGMEVGQGLSAAAGHRHTVRPKPEPEVRGDQRLGWRSIG